MFCCILKEILDRTGYSLEITSGQRKYGGPPPNYTGPQPVSGQEVLFLCLSLKHYLASGFWIIGIVFRCSAYNEQF